MSDHSNMLIESPASSRATTPPTLDVSQPLRIIPIGALGEATKNDIAALLQTDGVTPTVGSKTVAMFGYFALHAMWSLIAWESLLALAEWIEVFDLGFLLVF